MKTYMVVTADRFELPCGVFDKMAQVAQFLGCSVEHARQALFHGYVVARSYHIIRVDYST